MKQPDNYEKYIYQGGEVKALGDGKVGGYLVRYSTEADPDLVGDYFSADTDFGDADKSPVLYHHGADLKVGRRKIGKGELTRDDVGVWIEAQLELRNEYEQAVYEMAKAGKLGWSSGTAGHLVDREQVGKAWKITSWPLGLDASLTPTPAEPRNHAVSLKSLLAELEAQEGGSTAEDADTSEQAKPITTKEGVNPMTDEIKNVSVEIDALIESKLEAKALAAEAAAKTEAERQEELERARNEGIEQGKKDAHALLRSGGNFNIADANTLGGDHDGLKAMDAALRDRDSVKTLTTSESDTPKAGYLVIPQWREQLIELIGVQSIMRAAGAQVQSNFVGESFKMPSEATGSSATTRDENAEITASEPVFAERVISPFKPSYKVTITNETLENNSYDLLGYLARRAAKAIAAWENTNFFTGNASTGPGGAVLRATAKAAASASAIGADDLIDLLYGMDGQFSERGVFVVARNTLAAIRKLKGDNFLFNVTPLGTGNAAGQGGVYFAETINGRRVHTNSAISAVGAGNTSAVFFDPAEYQIVDWRNLTIMVDPYSEAEYDRTRYIITARMGGDALSDEAFVKLVHPTA